MSKHKITGTELDTFFVNKPELNEIKEEKLQKSTNTELQNYDITESQTFEKAELQKVRKAEKQKIPKRDDSQYKRVTVAILRKKIKKIKDFMWEQQIKNFDDALDLFISDKPLR